MAIQTRGPAWAATFLAAALLGCSAPPPPQAPVRAVKLMTVGVDTLQGGERYAAEVRARVETPLAFRVAGRLTRRAVDAGQRVRAGQVLAELDPQDLQLAAQAADAQVRAARTQRDLVAADLERFRSLREQGFISGAELDRRRTALQAAEAALAQAEAGAAVQRNQAGYTQLLADADGVVLSVAAEPGQVLSAGTVVLTLARDGTREAAFAVPETRVAGVRPGMAVQVQLWQQAQAWPGKVREVAAGADPATRTYRVRATFDAEAAQAPLGATATVSLARAVDGLPAIKLPTTALWRQGAGQDSAVWVFDAASGSVQARSVQVAGLDGNQAVLSAGVQPGERVVLAGVHVLTEGEKVVPFVAVDSH